MIAAPKLIAEPVIEALCGAQQMGDHRVALHFGRRSGDGLQRLAGFLPDGGVIEGLERAFAFLRLRIRFPVAGVDRRFPASYVISSFFTARFSKKYTLNAVSCRNASPRRPFSGPRRSIDIRFHKPAQPLHKQIYPAGEIAPVRVDQRDRQRLGAVLGQDLNQVAGA